ncbi:MAG: FadR family transcriptional regulator [Actinobacteria bacterium]|nr:FadR family transcriptional regulator [Actinomycetota bacterium]
MIKIIQEEPIERFSVSEGVLKRIIELIRKGDLKPGDKLPSIQIFSEKMRVGASSVREALKQLQIIGLVTIKQGEGTFISDKASPAYISNNIGYLLDMKKPDILYCLEIRKIIEKGAVALAAERASENEINKLGDSIQRMKGIIDNPKEFALENINFHLTIVEASKNPILPVIFNSIYDLFIEEQQIVANVLDLKSKSIEHHKNIYNAIKNHNIDKAIKEMEKHLNHIQQAILNN